MVHAYGGSFISETCVIRPDDDDGASANTRLCNRVNINVSWLAYCVDPYTMCMQPVDVYFFSFYVIYLLKQNRKVAIENVLDLWRVK
jgi:hypothetical protein